MESRQRSAHPDRKLRTAFLDRDGVINEKMPEGQYVRTCADFHVLPGVPEAIKQLNRAGIRVLVVSNQRGISLGLYTAEDLNAIHGHLQAVLAERGASIDAFYFCPHDKNACDCRKPLPGLYHQALAEFPDITPETSVMIGDSLVDIEFGRSLGMRSIFIEGNPERQKAGADRAAALADQSFSSLREAVAALTTASDETAAI